MKVLFLSWWLSLAVLLQYPGDVAGQFTAPPPTFSGVTFTFRCTVNGSGSTQWRVNGSSNLCTLPHVSSGNVSICTPSGASHPFTATPESGFGTNGLFTSTLSATADPVLDGTLVECFGPDVTVDPGNRVGNGTIQIVGGCNLRELWDLSAGDVIFLSDVSLLNDSAAQHPRCDDGSVGSVVLRDNILNTATVAYYTGAIPGSTACFVCDRSSEYQLNATNERVCLRDGTWSGSPIVCECSLPPWTIISIMVAVFAVGIALLALVSEITRWIHVSCTHIIKVPPWWWSVIITFLFLTVIGTPVALVLIFYRYKKGKGADVWWWCTTLNVFFLILNILGVVAFAVGFNAPNDNGCDPGWLGSRDATIYSALVYSTVAYLFTASLIGYHVYWHNKKMNWCLIILLMVPMLVFGLGFWILFVVGYWIAFGLGFWIAMLCAKRGDKGETEDEGETDETSQKTKHPVPEGSVIAGSQTQLLEVTDLNPPSENNYKQQGENGETGGGKEYSQPSHGHDFIAAPNPVYPNYSHLEEGVSRSPPEARK